MTNSCSTCKRFSRASKGGYCMRKRAFVKATDICGDYAEEVKVRLPEKERHQPTKYRY